MPGLEHRVTFKHSLSEAPFSACISPGLIQRTLSCLHLGASSVALDQRELELHSVGMGRNDPVSLSGAAFFLENNFCINKSFNSLVWSMV